MTQLFKYSSAAYLLLIMLIKMMGMQIAVLDYALNRDFIATNLCENRLAPQTHCQGKCYLKKQLAKTSESPESNSRKTTGKVVDVDFFEKTCDGSDISFSDRRREFLLRSTGKIPSAFPAAIFHPPLA